MVYAIHVEQIERDVANERQVVAVLIAAGVKKVEMPTLSEQRTRFDEALLAEPKQSSPEHRELRRAIGLD